MNKNSSYQSGAFYEVGDTVRLKKDYKIYVFECIKQGITKGSLTFNEDFYKEVCDGGWYVYAKRQVRKQRLMETRGYSKTRVRDMFRNQKTDRFFREHADYVIDNHGQSSEILIERLRRRLHRIELQVKK